MKLVQKILSHGMLIAFFTAVFFLYLYRVDVFPQWFAKQDQSGTTPAAVSKSETAPAASQTEKPSLPVASDSLTAVPGASQEPPTVAQPAAGEPTAADPDLPPLAETGPAAEAGRSAPVSVDKSPEPVTETAAAGGTVATEPAQESPAAASSSASSGHLRFRPLEDRGSTSSQQAAPAAGAESVAQGAASERDVTLATGQAPAAAKPFGEVAAPKFRPLKGEVGSAQPASAQAQSVAGSTMAAAEPASSASASQQDPEYQQQLADAREYFWRQDVQGAEQAYTSLAESFPERVDAWGELGNLQYSQGNWTAAADAYYKAIVLLIDQGEQGRARHMLKVLYGLDSARANELEQRLGQTGS